MRKDVFGTIVGRGGFYFLKARVVAALELCSEFIVKLFEDDEAGSKIGSSLQQLGSRWCSVTTEKFYMKQNLKQRVTFLTCDWK